MTKYLTVFLFALALNNCSDDDENKSPVAVAPQDIIAFENTVVTLDGSTSSDSDGTIAAYAWTQTSGEEVTITDADKAIATLTTPEVTDPETPLTLVIKLTVTDNKGAKRSDEVTITVNDNGAVISGRVTYDFIPHNTSSNALDYNNVEERPIRGAVVELVDGLDNVLDTADTDEDGNYSLIGEVGVESKVRVLAQIFQSGRPGWDFQVVDNTNAGALYVLDGELTEVLEATETRNLRAESGWGDTSYTGARTAAPFAILDSTYLAFKRIQEANADHDFDPLILNWSTNNIPTPGDKTIGQITTTHYTDGNIYILGAADNDTDEFDKHVIIHEWGHYFEDKFSRADSIGGSHSANQRLDPRLAFGEGWGNAWSGIATDDPIYRDSFGGQQNSGFSIDVENNININSGWYNEGSVQSIIYDLYDATNDDSDNITLGFKPIYDVLVGAQKTTPAITSIFSFATYLKAENAPEETNITNLLNAQAIVGATVDIYGSTETNDAGDATHVLPVFTEVFVDGPRDTVCSSDAFGVAENYKWNKIGARRFVKLNIPSQGSYKINATSQSNTGDPDLLLFNQGVLVNGCSQDDPTGCSENRGVEEMDLTLSAGDYTLEVFDYINITDGEAGAPNCFDITITAN